MGRGVGGFEWSDRLVINVKVSEVALNDMLSRRSLC